MIARRVAVFALIVLATAAASATTFTWTGAASNLWSNPANWTPSGIPGAVDTLVFNKDFGSSTNDRPPGSPFGTIEIDAIGFTVNGNAILLNGTIYSAARASGTLAIPVDLAANASFGPGSVAFTAPVNLHNFTLSVSHTLFQGGLAGTGKICCTNNGQALTIVGNNSFSGTVQVSTSLYNATLPADLFLGDAALSVDGSATVRSITAGGWVSIGETSPALLTTTDANFSASTSITVFLSGTEPGTGYSQLVVNGKMTGPGACGPSSCHPTLNLYMYRAPYMGQVFTIVKNNGSTPVPMLNANFTDLAEGSTLTIYQGIPFDFRVSYTGGSGHDFTLTSLNGYAPVASVGLVSNPNPVTQGQQVTFTASVSGNAGVATGTVSFKDGATLLGMSPTAGGIATFSTSSLPVGARSITAVYNGDGTYSSVSATSAVVTQTVSASTSTALQTAPNPSAKGQVVTLTAMVTSSSPAQPAGTVTFKDGASTLGISPLSAGAATFSTSTPLAPGQHNLTAVYNPSSTAFALSMSPVVVHNVDSCPASVPPPQLTITYSGMSSGCAPPAAVCTPGEAIMFSVFGANYIVQSCDQVTWFFGDATTAAGETATHSFAEPGTFAVSTTVANWRGSGTASILLPVGSTGCERPKIDAGPLDESILIGMRGTLSITASGPGPLSYQWYEGVSGNQSRPVAGERSAMFITPPLTTSHDYWVRVSSNCGFTDSGTARVTIVSRRRSARH
jgi:hypothetical protein